MKIRKVFKKIVTFIESGLDAQRSGWMTSTSLSLTTLRLSMRKTGQGERGKLLAEFLVGTIDSLDRSTTRKLVVSAFGRAGLFYNMPDPH